MNTSHRLWLLAAVCSVVFAVVPLASCGTPKSKCNATTCFGCCDAAEQCQAGNSAVACGANATMCTSCAFGSICQLGVCSSGGTGGNGGGSTGGGTGGGATGGGTGGGATGGGTGGGATGGGTGGGVTGGGTGGGGPLLGDTCAAAQALQFVNGTATFTGTTSGYTHDFTSSCANPGQPDRVVTFTQPTTGEMSFSLVSTGFTPALSVHLYAAQTCGMEVGCFRASGVGATINHMQVVPAGTYAMVIDSTTTGGGDFTLTATRATPDAGQPSTLVNGVPLTVGGLLDSLTYYSVTVPSGLSSLTFSTTGGTGDVDLYAALGAPPDPQTAPYVSDASGNVEQIVISGPSPGVWYLALRGYAEYSGVTLIMNY